MSDARAERSLALLLRNRWLVRLVASEALLVAGAWLAVTRAGSEFGNVVFGMLVVVAGLLALGGVMVGVVSALRRQAAGA